MRSSAPFPLFVGCGIMKAEVADEDVVDTVLGANGKVRDGRLELLQRVLKAEVPDDAVSQIPENEIKRGRLPSRSCSIALIKLGSIARTQFAHCWISVSLSTVQRQEIAVQDLYNSAAGVHVLVH
jgi:hypothetical protein